MQEYLTDLPSLRKELRRRSATTEEADGSDAESSPACWDPGLPDEEPDFLSETRFELRREEASYLTEKVLGMRTASGQTCLMQWMVQHLDVATVWTLEEPWALLDDSGNWPALPASLRTELVHARHFGVEQAVVSPAAISITAGRDGCSCQGRSAHTG